MSKMISVQQSGHVFCGFARPQEKTPGEQTRKKRDPTEIIPGGQSDHVFCGFAHPGFSLAGEQTRKKRDPAAAQKSF